MNANGDLSGAPPKIGWRTWRAWRWPIPASFRIDPRAGNERKLAGGRTALLQAALLVVGYLLTVGSVVAFFAHYIGWGPSLLIVGGSHLALAVFGLSAAPADPESERLDQAEAGITPILRSRSRPPAFPPRTRSVP